MIRWGIRGRVLFLALMPMTVIVALLTAYFIGARMNAMDAAFVERGLALARQLAPASEYAVFSGNREMLNNLAASVMREQDVVAVRIADHYGRVLVATGPTDVQFRQPDIHAPEVFPSPDGTVVAFEVPITQSQTMVEEYLVSPLNETRANASGQVLGRIGVVLSRQGTLDRQRELLRDSLLIMVFGLLASAVLAMRLSRDVTRPILRLAEAVGKIRNGYLDVRVPVTSQGELRWLEQGINGMAESLKEGHERMQERILEATAQLSYLASHDPLTGLVNRREFEIRVEQAINEAERYGRTHTLCYIDLDQFKVVNDTCGHGAGDELLRQLTTLLAPKIRDRDVFARLGGDEFGLLLENCPLERAEQVSELLRRVIQDYRFVWGEKTFGIGASFGLVLLDSQTENVAAALRKADAACYAAKESGRNRIHVYQPDDLEISRRQGEMQWVARLGRAFEEERLRLYYQPIVALGGRHEPGLHFETLLRMVSEDGRSIIPPMAFIPAAERYGMMRTLDRWIISHTFAAYRGITGGPQPRRIATCAINLSGASLGDPEFLRFIHEALETHSVVPADICFEITETAAISNLSSARDFITALKNLGCRFALDDFGSGLSSFGYLKNLPVDYLKIDGAFVKDMADDPVDAAMVQAINNIGHVLALRTIAEFVETEAVLQKLREIGVDYAQGTLLAAPKPLEELLR